jgi:hypothetical protein
VSLIKLKACSDVAYTFVAFEIRMLEGIKREMTVNSKKKTMKLIKASLMTRTIHILWMMKNIG